MKNKETKETHNFKSKEAWQDALNCAPQNAWTESRQLGGRKKSTYIPIHIQQGLADIFFDEFNVFDATFEVIVNEVLCTVKISVLPSYPNAEYRTISGSAAKPIQMKSGSDAERFPKGKLTNSLEYNAPAARSAAISNALTTFGNVFGRNIGRAVAANFNFSQSKSKNKKKNGKK